MEHSEHLVGIFGLGELGFENGGDLGFNIINLLIVSPLSAFPMLVSFLAHVQNIESIKELVGVIDLSQSDVFKVLLVARYLL